MDNLPYIFQVRKNVIIGYTDYSCLPYTNSEKNLKETERKKNCFSSSAKKRMKRLLDIWDYTISGSGISLSFITLTISSKMINTVDYNLLLKNWLAKMQYRYGKFNYVWKCEFQINGNIHYHLIVDCVVDWRVIRGVWNKVQSIHVDNYQKKMKDKYRNGYYFDTDLIDNNNNTIEDKIQYKRYTSGVKANYRNPNSTDIVMLDSDNGSIGKYINKYINKETDSDNIEFNKCNITRFWGSNDKLKLITYCTIHESDLSGLECNLLANNEFKDIRDDMGRIICKLYNLTNDDFITNNNTTTINNNRIILQYRYISGDKTIKKDLKNYKLFSE